MPVACSKSWSNAPASAFCGRREGHVRNAGRAGRRPERGAGAGSHLQLRLVPRRLDGLVGEGAPPQLLRWQERQKARRQSPSIASARRGGFHRPNTQACRAHPSPTRGEPPDTGQRPAMPGAQRVARIGTPGGPPLAGPGSISVGHAARFTPRRHDARFGCFACIFLPGVSGQAGSLTCDAGTDPAQPLAPQVVDAAAPPGHLSAVVMRLASGACSSARASAATPRNRIVVQTKPPRAHNAGEEAARPR